MLIHLNIPNIEFNCPYCGKHYADDKDIYLNRCNRNKSGFTTINCDCGKKFGMTYNYKGDAVSFKPQTPKTCLTCGKEIMGKGYCSADCCNAAITQEIVKTTKNLKQ